MQITGIHHAAIICSDYEKSKAFYVDILGFPIISESLREERQSHKLNLLLPDKSQIELFSFPKPPKRLSYPEACGLRHLAFTVENLEQILQDLNSKGITSEAIRTDLETGKRFSFIADPDGLPIEFYEE